MMHGPINNRSCFIFTYCLRESRKQEKFLRRRFYIYYVQAVLIQCVNVASLEK